jgi:hypothetical protein
MVMQKVRVVLLIILLSATAFAFEAKDYVTFFGTSDQTVTMEWTASANAISYELRAYHNEQEIYIWMGDTTGLTFAWQLPKSGHYTFMVRAVGSSESSDWSLSTDPNVALVNEQPRAWWAYGYVAPPGPIIIE